MEVHALWKMMYVSSHSDPDVNHAPAGLFFHRNHKGEQCTGGSAIVGAMVAGPIGAGAGAVVGHQVCKK